MINRLIDRRYRIRSRIARGGMATVYLATDTRLERRVAIKVMHGHLADDSAFTTRFVQEARSAARLGHPNVISVFDQGQDEDMAYMVMEYLPGLTLRDLLRSHGKLTPAQTVDIMSSVLSGLAAAHAAGIVHRDIKPENVLLANDGRIKIGDFGLARAATANTATGQALLGTIAYLSPELLTRGEADTRSDIYALGIMLHEMLTGEQPFQGEQPMQIAYQHANETVPTPSSSNSHISPVFDDLVLWATARDPDERPRDAGEMLAELERIESILNNDPDGATTAIRRIAPAKTETITAGLANTLETENFDGGAPRHRTGPVLTPGAKLAKKQARRRRRGLWIFGAVLGCASLAAGTGWYFSAGPGAFATVPDVAGATLDVATSLLTSNGLAVGGSTECTHPSLAPGAIVSSNPTVGARIGRGKPVILCVSTGPKMIAVPDVVGLDEEDARQKLGDFSVGQSQEQFSDEDEGTVLQAFDGAGEPLGDEYGERQPVTLLVSAGSIPDVEGMSMVDATAAVKKVGLSVSTTEEVFSDDIPVGNAVVALPVTSPLRPGDSVFIRVSKGPDLVAVPDVVGTSWGDAKEKLEEAGFSLDYNIAADLAPGLVRVSATDPDAGGRVKKGSKISVSF